MSTAMTLVPADQAPALEPDRAAVVVRCDASHDAAWNQFVETAPRGSFYHRAEWRAINRQALGHETAYLAAFRDDRVVGVYPMVRVRSLLFGNIACSMPFVNFGGPCGETDAVEEQLLEAGKAVAAEWKVDYSEIRSRRRLDGYACSDHKVSMTIELDADPEVVFGRFKRDHRAEIRRAHNHGFEARFGPELLDDFYLVLSETWRDLGTPIYRRDYFQRVLQAFPDSSRICVVYAPDGAPVAAAFDGIHHGVVEGMWLGIRAAYRRQLAGYVLYWQLIKRACEDGHRRFHLGRSTKDSGAEQFKKKWNADALQLYWHYDLRARTTIPGLNPTNPKYRLAIESWRRLPVRVTQIVGPMIARSIP